MGVCEESEIVVGMPVVVPPAELVLASEETTAEDVNSSCAESEIDVGIPGGVVFFSAELVSVSGETSAIGCERMQNLGD